MKPLVFSFSFLFAFSGASQSCKKAPEFIVKKGFDINSSALISTDRRTRGVLLVQYKDIRRPELGYARKFQDPTWDDAGFVSSITLDNKGDAYILPSAMVNTIHNPPEGQNTIHRINGISGAMNPFVKLPMSIKPGKENAFGLMSSFFHCSSEHLIVSSIAGSDQLVERGAVFAVDVNTRKVKQLIHDKDVLGVALVDRNGFSYLIYGLARKSQVWSLKIDQNFNPIEAPYLIAEVSNLGPRGDDKIKKIKVAGNQVLLEGVPFYYNLTAPVSLPPVTYILEYDSSSQRWILKNSH